MPFTFSHPAVVLPLAYLPRRWFSMTGLVIGSLTPDFEYFIRMRIQSDYSHGISGMFWFDLPLGILLAFIFHNIVRDSLCDNLPTMLKSRFFDFTTFNWKEYFKSNWVVVIISVLIGTGSHILWDGFTHGHGYFVTTYSTLTETIDVFDVPIPVYKISQHSSTLIGGIVILIAIFKLPQNEKVKGFLNLK